MTNRVLSTIALLQVILTAGILVCPTPASAAPALSMMTANQAAPVAEPNAILGARFPLAGLTLTATPGLTQLAGNEGEVTLGRVSLLKTPVLTETFRLKNTSNKPLTLDHLQTSCHCTSAAWEMEDGKPRLNTDTAPLTLLPGRSVSVQVRLNLKQMAAGQVVKSVMVFLTGQTQPAALVTFVADIQPVVSFWPPQIDFGQVSPGAPRTVTLTADFDPALAEKGNVPALVSSNPNIQITAADAPNSQEGLIRRAYSLTLLPDVAGPISGSLSFAPAVSPGSSTTADAALANVSVAVSGQVVGAVAAEPAALALGPVPGKHSAEGSITLRGQTERTLAGATVKSDSPYVVARLEGASPEDAYSNKERAMTSGTAASSQKVSNGFGGFQAAAANSTTMSVTVAPNAPLGKLQTQVRVTLANGQTLLVPVTAYVIAADALR